MAHDKKNNLSVVGVAAEIGIEWTNGTGARNVGTCVNSLDSEN